MRQEVFEKFVMQNRKKYDAFNLSAAFTGRVCEFPQVSMTKMILRIKLPLTMLKAIGRRSDRAFPCAVHKTAKMPPVPLRPTSLFGSLFY